MTCACRQEMFIDLERTALLPQELVARTVIAPPVAPVITIMHGGEVFTVVQPGGMVQVNPVAPADPVAQ